MKIAFVILAFAVGVLQGYGQINWATIVSSKEELEGKTVIVEGVLRIFISDHRTEFRLWKDIESADSLSDQSGLVLETKSFEKYFTEVQSSRDLWPRWSNQWVRIEATFSNQVEVGIWQAGELRNPRLIRQRSQTKSHLNREYSEPRNVWGPTIKQE